MEITAYSIIMSVICSDIFVITLYCLRRKKILVRNYGIILLMALYVLTVVRMFVPFEFSFTKGVAFPAYNAADKILERQVVKDSLSVAELLVFLWVTGAAFFFIRYLYTYRKAVRIIRACTLINNPKLYEILNTVNKKYNQNIRVIYRRGKNISVPMGFGVLHKTILLPEQAYNSEELYYIIAHECNHFYNRDLLVKAGIKVFCCIFWWNPVVYFLYNAVESTLEMKCDYTVCRKMSRCEIDGYIQTIIHEVKRMLENNVDEKFRCVEAVCFLKNNSRDMIKERIEALADRSKKTSSFSLAVIVVCFTVITLLSYVFVCQPYYPAPDYDENGKPYYSGEQLEIYKDDNGEFWVKIAGTDQVFQVYEEYIELLLEDGVPIREE